MIVKPSASHLRLFFTLRGSILLEVVPQIAVVMVWSTLIAVLYGWAPQWCPSFNGAALSLIGIALSIFMGFRNSICDERWWEGRRQFGALVSHARQFAREACLIAYAFFGLDELAAQLERPFDTHPNGLPIEALADTIEINLRETLGEVNLPALPAPRNHLLM